MIIFHQQVFHNCEMSKGCCVFKILSSVFAKTVQESFENATGFVRNVHFLQFVLPPDFYNCAKKFWNCHHVCRWDESALKALQGVKWPDAIYNSFCLFLETHTIYPWGGEEHSFVSNLIVRIYSDIPSWVWKLFEYSNIFKYLYNSRYKYLFGHSFLSIQKIVTNVTLWSTCGLLVV